MFFLFRCASAETLYFNHAVTRTFTECLPAEMHWEAAPKTHAKARAEVASTGGRIALSCVNKAGRFCFHRAGTPNAARRVNHTEDKLDKSPPPPILTPAP